MNNDPLPWEIDTMYFVFFQKAEAQLAYELQAAKIQQKIRNEEIQIQVCSRYQIILQIINQFIKMNYR